MRTHIFHLAVSSTSLSAMATVGLMSLASVGLAADNLAGLGPDRIQKPTPTPSFGPSGGRGGGALPSGGGIFLGDAVGRGVGRSGRGRAELRWDQRQGIIVSTATADACFGGNDTASAMKVRFPSAGNESVLRDPELERPGPGRLVLRFRVVGPSGVGFVVERAFELRPEPAGAALVETFQVIPSQSLTDDLEIEAPFSLKPVRPRSTTGGGSGAAAPSVTLPLKNGWAKTLSLAANRASAEYRLGQAMTGKETLQLALPMAHVGLGQGQAALYTDPTFSGLFSLEAVGEEVRGTVRFRYAGRVVPLRAAETRTFGLWLSGGRKAVRFAAAVDRFFGLMLPDVAPGPAWLHDIAMVGYDFLSDDGQGWERDVRLLARWLKPGERRRVALGLHGWYDALGSYCYDSTNGRLKDQWVAFARTRKVKFTQAELIRRLRLARNLGFRVLLYFGDGLAADSGVPGYQDAWAYRDAKGNKITGWQGPDTFGTTYLLNPAHPEVRHWFVGYLDAQIKTYGAEVDGWVWDETFHARTGQIAREPAPAYADRAMFNLVRELTRRVDQYDSEKVFLASDCIGVAGWEDVPGYGMVADGTYQDSHCDPGAWSYGLFPNWRNTLWSCNWDDVTGFHYTRWAVEHFGVPVALSNGWGDDCGPAEWHPWQRDRVLQLFRARLKRTRPLRYLSEDPVKLLARSPDHPQPGDPLPQPGPTEVNWALASQGSTATASSAEESARGRWPAAGVIDGRREEAGWGGGHGWASQAGQPLPQDLEVNLGRTRSLCRFVVITYQKENSLDTAAKWGVTDYDLQVWDPRRQAWKRVVSENRGRVAKVRVHTLDRMVRTDRFRIVVNGVAPLDGQARLLQVEAWGPTD